MAVNSSRNMREDLEHGIKEGSYMELQPMWGGPMREIPVERYLWPTYAQADRHQDCGCYKEITPREPGPGSANQQFNVPKNSPALPSGPGSGL
jgi:hypothetical protein